ncbi:hypothetical protein [Roseobacter litoralis]|uniref:hypothetical protein n=1 Tax=Roseobacter litoralis TaxID=42443 RepID=UPI0024957B4D|nr:hypothetical protein [Roseobacter litoralis]
MTFKDLDKKALGSKEMPEEKTTPANTSVDKKPHKEAASTDTTRALRPAKDDDMFDNMPV